MCTISFKFQHWSMAITHFIRVYINRFVRRPLGKYNASGPSVFRFSPSLRHKTNISSKIKPKWPFQNQRTLSHTIHINNGSNMLTCKFQYKCKPSITTTSMAVFQWSRFGWFPLVSYSTCSGTELLGISGAGFLQAGFFSIQISTY